jgi:predicted TIM-barrel fold metal-dependent hydrolase
MDRDGVQASVLFPPIIAMNPANVALRDAIVSAFNDWVFAFASSSPDRFIPAAMLSPLDAQSATNELVRLAKTGKLKQVNFLVNDVTVDMQLSAWDVFWSTAEELGIIVSYHVGGSLRPGEPRAVREALLNSERPPEFDLGVGNGGQRFFQQFVDMFTFGTLERHPKLKFVLAESGAGWVPYVVQEMDFRYGRLFETGTSRLKEKPSDVFKRQVWATYQSDVVGLHVMDFFGDGHVMWASDYPHHDSTWPFSDEIVGAETAHLSAESARAVLRDNAAALYGLS